MNYFKPTLFLAFLFTIQICSADDRTNDAVTTTTSPVPEIPAQEKEQEQTHWFKKTTGNAIDTVENLYENGRLSMILSGYAHHGRNTYTQARLDELNEKVLGLGISKELRDKKDNEESIQFLIMADSHYRPQILANYNYQWMKPLGDKWEAGIGYVLGLASRTDIIGGIPFPGILPLASIGTRDTKLMLTYIPRFQGKGNGDVLFLALRVSLK